VSVATSYKSITEVEFSHIPLRVFSDPATDRRYGRVDANGLTFAFGWRSDLIEPTIMELGNQEILVAVDQDVAVIEVSSGRVSMRMNFPHNFLQALLVEDHAYLATELCVYELVGPSWQVRAERDLPDNFEAFDRSSGRVSAICMDGTSVLL